jgi:hypothetical protein
MPKWGDDDYVCEEQEFLSNVPSILEMQRSHSSDGIGYVDHQWLRNLAKSVYALRRTQLFIRVRPLDPLASHGVVEVKTNDNFRMTFSIPHDFCTLRHAFLCIIPDASAAQIDRNIDIHSSFCGVGEVYNENSISLVSELYDLSASAFKLTQIDLSPVLNGIEAGDLVGIHIDHNGVGGSIYYAGICFEYCRKADLLP